MRRYDDHVEVRKGMVAGAEGPEQFLWRGRLWKVSDVLGHWMETGPWWHGPGMRAVLGCDSAASPGGAAGPGDSAGGSGSAGVAGVAGVSGDLSGYVSGDLSAEREVWRVEAARGFAAAQDASGSGVFDLVFDWSSGSWRLARCMD